MRRHERLLYVATLTICASRRRLLDILLSFVYSCAALARRTFLARNHSTLGAAVVDAATRRPSMTRTRNEIGAASRTHC